jgi:hypothetical protein
MGIGSGVMEIATALIGIALIALLVNRASDTSKLIQTTGGAFNDLLRTVTLQNSGGMGGMGY